MCQFPVQLDALYYSELLKVTTVISSYYLCGVYGDRNSKMSCYSFCTFKLFLASEMNNQTS